MGRYFKPRRYNTHYRHRNDKPPAPSGPAPPSQPTFAPTAPNGAPLTTPTPSRSPRDEWTATIEKSISEAWQPEGRSVQEPESPLDHNWRLFDAFYTSFRAALRWGQLGMSDAFNEWQREEVLWILADKVFCGCRDEWMSEFDALLAVCHTPQDIIDNLVKRRFLPAHDIVSRYFLLLNDCPSDPAGHYTNMVAIQRFGREFSFWKDLQPVLLAEAGWMSWREYSEFAAAAIAKWFEVERPLDDREIEDLVTTVFYPPQPEPVAEPEPVAPVAPAAPVAPVAPAREIPTGPRETQMAPEPASTPESASSTPNAREREDSRKRPAEDNSPDQRKLTQQERKMMRMRCHKCFQMGHIKSHCPENGPPSEPAREPASEAVEPAEPVREAPREPQHATCRFPGQLRSIGGKRYQKVNVLFGSGSSSNAISRSTARKLFGEQVLSKNAKKLSTANDGSLVSQTAVRCVVVVGGYQYHVECLVLDNFSEDVLLGCEVFFKCSQNLREYGYFICKDGSKLPCVPSTGHRWINVS
ncbi:hypothetical protein DICA3_C00188 [Diutina catenulata]